MQKMWKIFKNCQSRAIGLEQKRILWIIFFASSRTVLAQISAFVHGRYSGKTIRVLPSAKMKKIFEMRLWRI
jgi:hypothetical protein